MQTRRNFLKQAIIGLGASVTTTQASDNSANNPTNENLPHIRASVEKKHDMHFNMCGYSAPKLDTVRVGIIGLGLRGNAAVKRLLLIDDVEIVALCDTRQAALNRAQDTLQKANRPKAKEFTGSKTAFKALCDLENIDLIYIATPWEWHAPVALTAMEHDKHTAIEVPAAKTIDECWALVETSEKTKKHCVLLENCCYDFFELLTLNMVRQGLLGNIVHAEGAYIHHLTNLVTGIFDEVDGYNHRFWRLKENIRRANLYPTHGLGPICQAMNINRGDRLESLTSIMSEDFSLKEQIRERAKTDSKYQQFLGKRMRGNMDMQFIHTAQGSTIMLQHDVYTPRPYSRIHMLSGEKGFVQKYPCEQVFIEEKKLNTKQLTKLKKQYNPKIIKDIGDLAKKVGGHGGMDFMMDWRLIDCLKNGLPVDIDVYDAVAWSCITPLSEYSIANNAKSIKIPDFTRGAWKTNKPSNFLL